MSNPEKAATLYVKSFFAGSVPAAMEQARLELGPDALLLNSRKAPAEARHLGDFEVVFGAWPDTSAPAIQAVPAAPAPCVVAAPQSAAPSATRNAADERPRQVSFRRPLRRRPGARALAHGGKEADGARSIERRARKRTTHDAVLHIARPHSQPTDPQAPPTANDFASRFEVSPEIGRVTVLVGPPGSGKTTTLVKLAINQCLTLGRAVRLISTDTLRIGGAEQLRTYAAILGVPFQAVESTVGLAQAIDSTPANTWVLIDTPGFSAVMQQELGGDLAMFLRRRQDIDTHLVLTASMDQIDLQNTTDRFAAFNPSKLIFTRLDETSSAATIISEAARTQKPLSFLCDGQSVPEDIQAATKEHVVDLLVRQLPDSLQAVA